MNSPHVAATDLFSIDVDAHLTKAATHTFGSAAHYPVELVRAALRRGAQRVDVRIGKASIQVQDDGAGLEDSALNILSHIMNPDTVTAEKEWAVESLQTRESLGLLAIFAPQPTEILVETTPLNSPKKHRLHLHRHHLTRSESGGVGRGTCITLHGKSRDPNREKELLDIFCRCVPANREIRVNNRIIGGQPMLKGQLAIMDITVGPACSEGQVGIPRSGSLCRLRLLDQGIPCHHFSLPPQQGFIFEAAVEYTGDIEKITVSFINHLLGFVEHMYGWLCRRYAKAPEDLKTRIEELIFNHHLQTESLVFLHQFAPFRFYNSPLYTGYSQIKEKASTTQIYAVPQKKERLRYNAGTGLAAWILSLTREQADLLINQLNVPITFLTPQNPRFYGLGRVMTAVKKKLKKMVLLFCPMPKKIVEGLHLSSEEAFFLRTLTHYLAQQGHHHHLHAASVKAVLTDSRFPFPVLRVPVEAAPGVGGNSVLYVLRRQHRLVRAAVAAVRLDRENIEIFAPLLVGAE